MNFDPLNPLDWDSGRFLKPAADARYQVLAGTATPKDFTINQRDFATSFIDGIDFNLRRDFLTFDPLVSDGLIDSDDPDDPDRAGELLHVDNGVLRIRLYGSANGDVVAGPIRIVRADGTSFRVQRPIDLETGDVPVGAPNPQQEIGDWGRSSTRPAAATSRCGRRTSCGPSGRPTSRTGRTAAASTSRPA